MNSYYCDEIAKMKYLRDRIASSLVMSGAYPDRLIIDKRLAAIDSKLALFQHEEVEESSTFDVKRFNNEFLSIYQDLKILYQLVYDFSVKHYEETRAYVEMHLSELERLASRYEKKERFETSSTSIGRTVFFQSSGFNQTTRNYITTVSLGSVEVAMGSKVCFFINGRYFKPEDVTFYLGSMTCTPFTLNSDYVTIPGDPSSNNYTCTFPNDVERNSMFVLNGETFQPKQDNTYIVYGGKNCIKISSSKIPDRFIEKANDAALSLNDSDIKRITFYVLNGSYINMEFSKQPISKNFSGYSVQGLKKHHKITFEYQGSLSFNFKTDGVIYATKKTGVVKGDQLLYPDADNLSSFLIEEYSRNDTMSLNLKATIQQSSDFVPMIGMIAVKELSVLDEVDDND